MSDKTSDLQHRLQHALVLREKKAADLVRDLNIPKSAVSQYLSGKSQKMDSDRLFSVSKYLNINEPWLLGYDVPMERITQKKADTITDAVLKMKTDPEFLSLVETLLDLNTEKIHGVKQMLSAFLK